MEPQIQYTKTSDGVNIAYWAMGEGEIPLLISPPLAFSHIALELQTRGLREWYETLAEGRMVVRIDLRGNGMSDRGVDSSPETILGDMAAVMASLSAAKIDLLGIDVPGAAAVEFAANLPGLAEKLVLWRVPAGEWFGGERWEALRSLIEKDWELYTETIAQSTFGWEGGRRARWLADFIRQSVNPADAAKNYELFASYDRTALLGTITAETLVLYEPTADGGTASANSSRELASRIPDARLVTLTGAPSAVWESPAATKALIDFLDEGRSSTRRAVAPAGSGAEEPSGTAIILFADIVESTSLTEKMGDAAFRDKARTLDEALRAIIRDSDGTPVEGKLLGDGVLSVFSSARQAIEAAMGFGKAAETVGLGLHVGIHAGDVIREGDNVFGGAVNIAARISGESEAGEVLVSQTVRELARTSAGVSFEDRGERELKGVGEPVRVWRVVGA